VTDPSDYPKLLAEMRNADGLERRHALRLPPRKPLPAARRRGAITPNYLRHLRATAGPAAFPARLTLTSFDNNRRPPCGEKPHQGGGSPYRDGNPISGGHAAITRFGKELFSTTRRRRRRLGVREDLR